MSIIEVIVQSEVENQVTLSLVEGSPITTITTSTVGPQGPQGIQGVAGDAGPAGADGADGVGVPVGGSTGQVLAKIDGTDYNTEWTTVSGGGGGEWGTITGTLSAQTDLQAALDAKLESANFDGGNAASILIEDFNIDGGGA